jgi:SulP family sulfate permease
VPAAKFKLATLVQYVPLPVVGGYLGYVGYFCLAAGIGLGCNTTINTFSSWANLFAHGTGVAVGLLGCRAISQGLLRCRVCN